MRNKQFAEDIQGQLGHKTDVSEIDKELDNYHKMIKKLEKIRWWNWDEEQIRQNLEAIQVGDVDALSRFKIQ